MEDFLEITKSKVGHTSYTKSLKILVDFPNIKPLFYRVTSLVNWGLDQSHVTG